MAAAFERAGYRTRTGDSPWRLARDGDGALVAALTQGIAQAVRETGQGPDVTVADWLAAKTGGTAGAETGLVGHLDLFARPA
jgi:hypothetical protein